MRTLYIRLIGIQGNLTYPDAIRNTSICSSYPLKPGCPLLLTHGRAHDCLSFDDSSLPILILSMKIHNEPALFIFPLSLADYERRRYHPSLDHHYIRLPSKILLKIPPLLSFSKSFATHLFTFSAWSISPRSILLANGTAGNLNALTYS